MNKIGQKYLTKEAGVLLITALLLFSTVIMVQADEKASPSRSDDWPMFRHDPTRNAFSTSNQATNNVSWIASIDSPLKSSPTIADGFVYVGAYDGNLYCYDASTGNLAWNYTMGGQILSTPAVVDGYVYFGSQDKNIYCLDTDGNFEWSYTTGGFVFSSPAVVNDKVYIGSYDKKMYCLNTDGTFVWSRSTGDNIFSSPAVVDGYVYFGSNDDKVYCLNAGTGGIEWTYPTGGDVSSSPAVAYGYVYVGSGDKYVYCLDAATGDLNWSKNMYQTVSGSPAVAYELVYITPASGFLHALDAYTGDIIWTKSAGYSGSGKLPAVADGAVYVGSTKDCVYSFNALTGDEIWNYTCVDDVASGPAIVDEFLYIAVGGSATESNLLCLGGGNEAPNTPSTPEGDTYGFTKVYYNYSTSATDPDGNKISYGWDWDGDLEVDLWTDLYDSGVVCEIAHKFTYAGVYEVRVKAKDVSEVESDWSDPLEVTIVDAAAVDIESIGGGGKLGLIGVSVVINNTGDVEATTVDWSISVTGGLLGRINESFSDTIASIAGGETYTIDTGMVTLLGLGPIEITVTVSCAEGDADDAEAEGFQLGPLTLVG